MPTDSPLRLLRTSAAVVGLGILVGLLTLVCLTLVRPVLVAFAFGALILLLPPLVMRNPRAYWLFLLAFSIPFDISKRVTTWLVQPWDLYLEFGLPASGTLSLDIYLTDIVLFALLVPWIMRLCLRRDTLFFPNVAYIFLLYLAWALIVSLAQAPSFYLSIFEWLRQLLYFASFLYIINNVVTTLQFRSIVAALFVGMTIASASVIGFFVQDVGTESFAFSGLYRQQEQSSKSSQGTLYVSKEGSGAQTKRSAGFFTHPAHAAYYLEYILPMVLAYLLAARRLRSRLVLAAIFAIGSFALYLTFARSAVVGLLFGFLCVIIVGRWSEMMSRRAFARCAWSLTAVVLVAAPLLIHHLATRPDPVTKRLELVEIALNTYWKRPLAGAGLNNSSIVTEGAESIVTTANGRERVVTVVHNHYLIVLIEVGLVGFLLFFGFFSRIAVIALQNARKVSTESKALLVGILGGFVSIAITNMGEPFGGHVVQAMLWLQAGLAIAACRQVDLGAARRVAPSPPSLVGATRETRPSVAGA